MTSRPNILIIITDQQSYSAMSCAGNHDLRTPAMDSLAETGVLFSKAYCTYPLCTPARASFFTGRMPHEVGIMGNGQPIDERFRSEEMGFLFQRAGYDCVYGGKWHVPEIAIPDGEHGFRRICGFDDAHLSERCSEYLGQPRQKPLMMVASFDNPHNICEWARRQVLPWGPIEEGPPEGFPMLPSNYAIPVFEPEAIRLAQSWNARVYPVREWGDEEWRRYRRAYFLLVEKVDAQIGRILDALCRHWLEEETLVVFTSDHGDGMGAHQWNQKSVFYDEVARVPFILSYKGVTRAGKVDDSHLVSVGLDLLPTICDYAEIELPEGLRGSSVRELAEGRSPASWRDAVFGQTVLHAGYRMHGRMVRTKRHKYAVYSWGEHREQLVDLEEDPGEMVNLAVGPEHADLLADHRRRLWEWCQQTGDLFDEHSSHRGRPSVPGYEYEE